jgi:hypothetical protein
LVVRLALKVRSSNAIERASVIPETWPSGRAAHWQLTSGCTRPRAAVLNDRPGYAIVLVRSVGRVVFERCPRRLSRGR